MIFRAVTFANMKIIIRQDKKRLCYLFQAISKFDSPETITLDFPIFLFGSFPPGIRLDRSPTYTNSHENTFIQILLLTISSWTLLMNSVFGQFDTKANPIDSKFVKDGFEVEYLCLNDRNRFVASD